jgi:hypothetical protein
MSMYIQLGKVPASPEERRALLAGRVADEDSLDSRDLTMLKHDVVDFLKSKKGYGDAEVLTDKRFHIKLPETSFDVSADIALNINGRIFLVIKCVINSVNSWERYSKAFCRVAEDPYLIPFAAVTDGDNTSVLDIMDGGSVYEGLGSLPSRETAVRIIQDFVPTPCPEDRKEREKRILYAFDAIKCSTTADQSNAT